MYLSTSGSRKKIVKKIDKSQVSARKETEKRKVKKVSHPVYTTVFHRTRHMLGDYTNLNASVNGYYISGLGAEEAFDERNGGRMR